MGKGEGRTFGLRKGILWSMGNPRPKSALTPLHIANFNSRKRTNNSGSVHDYACTSCTLSYWLTPFSTECFLTVSSYFTSFSTSLRKDPPPNCFPPSPPPLPLCCLVSYSYYCRTRRIKWWRPTSGWIRDGNYGNLFLTDLVPHSLEEFVQLFNHKTRIWKG